MFDFITTMVGVSFAVLALALTVAAASIVVCVVTLIKNLPKGIRALRAATESSVYALAFCGQSVAEEAWFARLQAIFGRTLPFRHVRHLCVGGEVLCGRGGEVPRRKTQSRGARFFPPTLSASAFANTGQGLRLSSAPVLKHSAVMKQ